MESVSLVNLDEDYTKRIEAFFWSQTPLLEPSEEKLVATRWLAVHQDFVDRIIVQDAVDAKEVVAQLHDCIKQGELNGALLR